MARIVQVTPTYPPIVSGVGDYASLISKELLARGYEINTLVLSTIPPIDRVVVLSRNTAKDLAITLESADVVLLHFSGYGYAHWGLCYWLVNGLRLWKEGSPKRRLVVVFHEVYASGPIWRTSFWTMFPQRQIARSLAQLSDAAFVTSQGGYRQLRELHSTLPLEVTPVFSNVGEPKEVPSLTERSPLAIVFGGARRRSEAYSAALQNELLLSKGFDQLGITQVIDIGPGNFAPSWLGDRMVKVLGTLPAQSVSKFLGQSRLGLMDYPRHVLTKSGIAAAYFAHGMFVLNLSTVGTLPDDLKEGREFVGLAQIETGSYEPQAVASAGLSWYLPHNVENTVEKIVHALL